MRLRALAVGIVCVGSLYAQSHRFKWQNYCFDHPAEPVCPGHEYAVKPPRPAKDASSRSVVTNPFAPPPRIVTPSVIVVGSDIDWRFADPFADGLIGFNLGAISGSPIARDLLVQLGTNSGFTEADMRKIIDGISGMSQIALAVSGNQVVGMVTGSGMDLALAPSQRNAGLKIAPVSRNAMLVGHADAVDRAIQRISMKSVPAEVTRLADGLQAGGEFWVIGSAVLAGPQAVNAGAKRFSMAVSIRDQVTTDVIVEFDREPNTNTLKVWQNTLGAALVEGNRVHFRMSLEAGDARQKLSLVTAPLGQRLADLLNVAKYLGVRDTPVQPQIKSVMIYGLDGGPKEVHLEPNH